MNRRMALTHYCEKLSSPPDPHLRDIERYTALKTATPAACSSPLQGRLLSMLAKLMQPKLIVEVGTFTTYSTLSLAEGLGKEGILITVESDLSLKETITRHIAASPWADRIQVIYEPAIQAIPDLPDGIELVFIDGAKNEYPDYYNLLVEKMAAGGLLIVDNVLWKSGVLEYPPRGTAAAMHQFNRMILEDARVESVILPLRDGLNLIRKV